MQVEFSHEIGAMSFGGFYAEAERRGDFFGRLAFCDKLNYLTFARRENLLGCSFAFFVGAQIAIEHHLRDFGSEEGSPVLQSFDGGDQVAPRIRFQQESASRSSQNFTHYLFRMVKGED